MYQHANDNVMTSSLFVVVLLYHEHIRIKDIHLLPKDPSESNVGFAFVQCELLFSLKDAFTPIESEMEFFGDINNTGINVPFYAYSLFISRIRTLKWKQITFEIN